MNTKLMLSALALAGVAAFTFAQEAAPAEDEGIKTKVVLGATVTDGNSETTQLNGGILVDGRVPDTCELHAGAEGNYSEDRKEDNKTVQNAKVFADAKKDIAAGWFGALNASYFHDKIADVDYRVTVGPAIGHYLVDNDTVRLSAEVGPSYVWEEVADETDDYLAFRAAERLDWTISGTATAWEQVEYLLNTEDTDNYLLNAEVGVESALSERLALRVVFKDSYNSNPADGNDENDISVVTALSVTL